MTKTFTFDLPHFCGFYESPLYNGDTLYNELYGGELEYLREEYGNETLDYDDFDIDFEEYKKACCVAFCDSFMCHINEVMDGLVENIEYAYLNSPREYNFRTDKVIAKVTLCDDWRERLIAFMEENEKWLREVIHDDWTSCDGFWSFMDNYYEEWLERFKSNDEMDENYLSVMLGYVLSKDDDNAAFTLVEDVLEEVFAGAFIVLSEEGKEKVGLN